jgi:hypothetical protein
MTDAKEQTEKQERAPEAQEKKAPELFIPRVPDLAGVVIEPTNSFDPHDRWFHPIR